MNRRAALLLVLSVVGLFCVGAFSGFRILSDGLRTVRETTDERLRAIGTTLARALAVGAGPEVLRAVRRDCLLEDAYLLGPDLRPVDRGPVALLRVDPDRALRAAAGAASVGPAYELEAPPGLEPDPLESPTNDAARPPGAPRGKAVLAGYFPVDRGGRREVLVLEAGASFTAAAVTLRRDALGVLLASFVLVLLCGGLLFLSLRAAARERLLFAQAERGRALTQMAAMVTHEIRNPLGTIRAGVELLREQHRRRDGESADDAEIYADVLSEIARLKDLSGGFLTLARDAPLQLGDCDLSQVCDELCAQLRREYPDLTIVREGAAAVTVTADGDKVRQILRNLLQNGAQALTGRGELRARVSATRDGAEVLVSDDGPGIETQLSRRLFEPFATTKEGGTGLGLVIARRFAERHGGSLTLLSAPRGAHFLLTLPRRPHNVEAPNGLHE